MRTMQSNSLVDSLRAAGFVDFHARDIANNLVDNLDLSGFQKIQNLKAKPIGFNYYSLIYEILLGSVASTATNRNAQLAFIASTGANMVRVALPCFSAAEYLTRVHSTATMPATMATENLRPTYIQAIDTAMDAAAALGIKLHVCDFFSQSITATACGETVATAYLSLTTKTVTYMQSATAWFFERYNLHPGFGTYSIGNEWVTDETSATAPSTTQLGAIFTNIASIGRSYSARILITSDMSGMGSNVLKTRPTPDTQYILWKNIFAGLDAMCVHIYIDGYNFTGHNVADNSGFPSTNANTLGLEGAYSLMSTYNAMATAMSKPLIIGEFGINTNTEADASFDKKRKFQKAVSAFSEYAMWWNVQDATTAASAGQSIWYIPASGTRTTTFGSIVTDGNGSKPRKPYVGGGMRNLRYQLTPSCSMTNGTARTASSVLTVTSTAAHQATQYTVMYWLKANALLTAFETLVNCRGTGNLSGFVVLGDSTASTSAYTEFRGAAGGCGNTNGTNPDLVVGEWVHHAVMYESLNGTTAITSWINGLFWKTVNVTNTLAVIPTATAMKILGDTSGAPVAMQDVAFLPHATPQDVWDHMNGVVSPQALMHIRAYPNGNILDVSRTNAAVSIGSGVVVVNE